MSALWSVLAFALLPIGTAIAGGVVAAFRPPGPKVRSYLQHFAAGVVFSVVGVELLPDVVRQHRPVQVVIGFALGTAAMLLIRSLSRRSEDAEAAKEGSAPAALVVAVGVDILIDGLLIGLAFAAGQKEGKLLTFALATEMLSLGLATATALGKSGASRKKIITTVLLLSLLIGVGAGAGASLLRGLSHGVMEIVLSFGLAALLFLVTEELLVEAHEEPETPLATATFFLGFLIFLVLGMIE